VHSTCCEAKVDQRRKAPNSTTTRRVTIRPRFVISPPPGLPQPFRNPVTWGTVLKEASTKDASSEGAMNGM
jgi:hypothetical protein